MDVVAQRLAVLVADGGLAVQDAEGKNAADARIGIEKGVARPLDDGVAHVDRGNVVFAAEAEGGQFGRVFGDAIGGVGVDGVFGDRLVFEFSGAVGAADFPLGSG